MKTSASGHRMLDFDDSLEDNRRMFVDRLIKAGWKKKEAEIEYQRLQDDDEGDPS